MRIITGSARGTKLFAPEGETTRPTTDKVKEAVFSMIQFDVEGRTVLDLFAGSGQMALEALSRGAERAVLVEYNKEALECIGENARKTHLAGRCRIVANTYTSYLRSAAGKESFNLIFLDPPYGSGMMAKALSTIAERGFASPGAVLVCETECGIPPKAVRMRKNEEAAAEAILRDVFGGDKALAEKYRVLKSPLYGNTRITLLTPADAGGESETEDEA